MLVLSRYAGEKIVIGENITITVSRVLPGRVVIGIEAPSDMLVMREELLEVEIDSELGKGSVFRITLPLTLAIIEGMVIRAESERYIVPLVQVYESLRPSPKDRHQVNGLGEVLHLRGENLPLHKLSQLIGIRRPKDTSVSETAIVVRTGAKPFAILVDEIIGHQQVVIKSLGEEMGNLQGITGGAILGDGAAALILDFAELVGRGNRSTTSQPAKMRGVS